MNERNKDIKATIKDLRKLDNENFYFIGAQLRCPHCEKEFGIDKEYMGVVTCPYCGKYVEG